MSLVQHTLLQRVWADKDCLNLCNDKNRRHLPPVFIVVRLDIVFHFLYLAL